LERKKKKKNLARTNVYQEPGTVQFCRGTLTRNRARPQAAESHPES